MSTTYGLRPAGLLPLLLLAFLATVSAAQSLEDKVSQARRLQAQSMLGMDQQAIDSVMRERRLQGQMPGQRLPTGSRRRAGVAPDSQPDDALISGPGAFADPEALDTLVLDSLGHPVADDSLKAAARRKPRLPKRYEQRIFQSVDRSAFSSSRGAAGRDHVLGAGDEITVSLWGDKEREYPLILNSDGKAFLEGVGLVPLAGLNLDEAQQRLKERMARIYSGIGRGTSHVDVSLGRTGPVKAFVLGEVKVPGGFVFTGSTSVLSAMYFAQGPSNIGTVRNLVLTRGGKQYPLDLYQYLIYGKTLSPDVLRDGDILFAGRADILVDIQGDVGRPATYELKKGEGIREILEFAGRLNPTAASQRMMLQRVFPGGKVDYVDLAAPQDYLNGKAKVELQDGDRILVERSTETSRNFITVTGPVKYPGTYSSEGVATVKDLVARAGGLREDIFLGRAHVVRFGPDGSSRLFPYSLDTTQAEAIRLEPRDNVLLYSTKDMYLPDTVEVSGAVFHPGRYEFREGMTAKDLIMQAGGLLPQHESGRLLVFRGDTRQRKVEQILLDVGEGLAVQGKGFVLQARDLVHVPIDPRWYNKEVVTLGGLFLRPGKYALLHPGEKLASVINRAGGFKDNAYVEGGRFFRTKDSVGRVGVDIGKALRKTRSKANIGMVGGDSIHIPERFSTVKVVGEVGFETSILFKEGADVAYYIERAGGFTRRSEKDRIVVQYANGETGGQGIFNRKPDAGSVIYVPQGPEPKQIDFVQSVNAILGTAGVVVALILSIQAVSK